MHTPSAAYRIVVLLVCLSMVASFFPAGARAVSVAPRQPSSVGAAALNQSVAVARWQTSYLPGVTEIALVITNDLPPARLPELPAGATITETVDILAAFSPADDVNTLRNVTVEDTLINGTTLIDASGSPVVVGDTLTWALPDLPPQATTVLTLSVQTPAGGGDFIELDGGALVEAEQWGSPISLAARPAVIIPGGMEPAYTLPTVDADSTDSDVLWKSASFAQAPLAAFEYVSSLDYDPYAGSLRGARGVVWGQAGNSVDKASLLIALLRGAGIPARYRHGALTTPGAQTLIGAMFPPSAGVAGFVPADAPVSDPLNDAALIALVSDHWWVEAYLPGANWTNLDPSFPGAQPGDVFAAPGGNDRIAELPDAMRHKVNVELLVEQYSAFPVSGSNLTQFVPLTMTYNTVELAGRSLSVGHIVETESQGGVYTAITHTYSPFFAVGGDDFLTLGDSFQDLLSSFPLATSATTAEWLTITIADPDGRSETFTRVLKDLVGLDTRLNGGNLNIAFPADNAPFITPADVYVATFLPEAVADAGLYSRQRSSALADNPTLAQASQTIRAQGSPPTPEEKAAALSAALDFQLGYARFLSLLAYDFAHAADSDLAAIENSLQVKLFYAAPRVIINAAQPSGEAGAAQQTMDLRSTRAEALAYPGQALAAQRTAQWVKGVLESYTEGRALQDATGLVPLTTARIFEAMTAQGIQPLLVTPETMYLLDLYHLPAAATAHAREALLEGKSVVIPSAPVDVDGELRLGWWEVDAESGETISVLENGLHSALEYSLLEYWEAFLTFYEPGDLAAGVKALYDWIVCNVEGAVQGGGACGGPPSPPLPVPGPPFPLPNPFPDYPPLPGQLALTEAAPATNSHLAEFDPYWLYLPAHLCPIENCGAEQFIDYDLPPGAQPLPEMLFVHAHPFEPSPLAVESLPVTDNGGGGDPVLSATATATETRAIPAGSMVFDVTLAANFTDDVIVQALAPEGWFVRLDDGGRVTVHPAPDAAPGVYSLDIVAQAKSLPQVFAMTQQTVDVVAVEALTMKVTADARTTIPVGSAAFPAVSGQTNDDEVEIPDSAFIVGLFNSANVEKAIELTVTGAPAGWIVLNGKRQDSAVIALDAIAQTLVGLYVIPPSLPPAGTSFTMQITASDGGALTIAETVEWTMPATPFDFLTIQPEHIYLSPDTSADFTLQITNNGNASGDFSLTASLPPITAAVSSLQTPLSLAAGETHTQIAAIETAGLPPGTRFPLIFGSPAPGSYTQYAIANVQIVSENSAAVFHAAARAETACALGEPGLADALEALAFAMLHLEAACDAGSCELALRDQAVAAAESAARYAGNASALVSADDAIRSIAAALADHTSAADILNDLTDLNTAVTALDGEICAISQHLPELHWTPFYAAALPSETVTYTLDLTNKGTVTTAYTLTVNAPVSDSQIVSLPPGTTTAFVYPLAVADLGLHTLQASAVAVDDDAIFANVSASLNVVDRYLQLTAVIPDPAFVETGVSSTTVSIEVANIANVTREATAQVIVQSATGAVHYAVDQPVILLAGAPRAYDLASVDTSGWAAGVYTVTVELLDTHGALIADGSGYGYFSVGQGLAASHAVTPAIVPPGTFTVTTVITAELLAQGILGAPLETANAGEPLPDGTEQALSGNPLAQTDRSVLLSADQPNTEGVVRYEEDHPALLYNGVPFTQTVPTWSRSNSLNFGSGGYYAASSTTGDSVSLTFDGSWFGVGFLSHPHGGQADIYLDGDWLETVELYANEADTASFYFGGLVETSHTVSVTVAGSKHPNSLGYGLCFDYIDVWDGGSMAEGAFEESSERVIFSAGWSTWANSIASGGAAASDDGADNGTVWFPFTGDSVTYQTLAYYGAHEVIIKLDGIPQGMVDVYSSADITRTLSFDGLGAGPHVLELRAYRGDTILDAFITPGVAPWYEPPAPPTGIVRYEEDDPALLYNGYPLTQSVTSWWPYQYAYVVASNGWTAGTNAPGSQVALEFFGSWVGVGFAASNGEAEIFIDGNSRGIVDLDLVTPITNLYFDDLITGTHTISVTRISGTMLFDFFDTWDGAEMGAGWYEARLNDHRGPYHYNTLARWYTQVPDYNWPRLQYARGDDVLAQRFPPGYPTQAWFTFTGDDLLLLAFERAGTSVEVFLDGVSQGVFDLTPQYATQPHALHFQDLGNGPHVASVTVFGGAFFDAFQVAPPDALPYTPQIEWWDDAPADVYSTTYGNYGMLSSAALGDLNGDGLVEIVAPASNGQMYVYRGDGQDTGGGSPLLWQTGLVGSAAEPALADLDGDGFAEIIVFGSDGMAALHHDGSTYWFTDTIQSRVYESGYWGWGGPSIGNVDLEPGPEIVLAAHNDGLYVLDHDGTILYHTPTGAYPAIPTLADLTGDGVLDILYAQGLSLTLFDYANNVIEWTRTHTYTGYQIGAYGSPAVADVDGQQPDGDDGPEVIINWGSYVDVLDEDGTLLWNYALGYEYYRPSPITIADVDGDGEIEILTASALSGGFWVENHKLIVLNADGSLLWQQTMGDTTASASGVATQDLNGDGVWEVLWNGSVEGFTIMNGPDGEKLFNEQFTASGTILDYPTLGDVDGDGYAEVVAGGVNGLFVIGHDGRWGDSRPLWNQHNYHITNVNDDLSIPANEANSWEVHNTYRTQTPERSPMPSYAVTISHTVGVEGVSVLTNTFNVLPNVQTPPIYGWNFTVDGTSPLVTRTFESALTGLLPGEARLVAEGTRVAYRLPGGMNWLTLPPLYVSVAHILAIEPAVQTAGAGATVVYTLTLTNPGPAVSSVSLALAGLPAGWGSLPAGVTVPALGAVSIPLTVTLPMDAGAATYPFGVSVVTDQGGSDQAGAALQALGSVVEVSLTPAEQTVPTGETAAYTLTVTNLDSVARTYALHAEGLAAVNLPAQISVAANSAAAITVTVQAVSEGANPFTVIAAERQSAASGKDTAAITGQGFAQVAVTIAPAVAPAGPGVPTVFAVTVTNLGSAPATYDLSANPPTGWDAALTLFGQPVASLSVAPGGSNAVEVQLILTPPTGAAQGDYPFTVIAASPISPVSAVAAGSVQVGGRGVQIVIVSGPAAISPLDIGIWQVQVTNTGDESDAYDLSAFGPLAAFAEINPSQVSLAPGQTQTVEVQAGPAVFALPNDFIIGVLAESQSLAYIRDEDSASVGIHAYHAVEAAWLPEAQTISGTLSAAFTLVVTNTGNVNTTYQFTVTTSPVANIQMAIASLPIPAHATVSVLVGVTAAQPGTYLLSGVAGSGVAQASVTATLTVTGPEEPPRNLTYLPVVFNQSINARAPSAAEPVLEAKQAHTPE